MNKFIFFYSPLYNYYHNHLLTNLTPYFEVEPILINDLNNNNKGHTFFGGVSIKIELIIQKIKENFNNFIIFSDATIFVNSHNVHLLSEFFDTYKNNDLCFANNDGNGYFNIGIILINCNQNTLSFFEQVLYILTSNKGWDQDVINKHLQKQNNLLVSVFNKEKILCGWEFNKDFKDTFFIFKSFIHHDSNIIKNFNKRLKIFYDAQLISNDEFNKNIKNEDLCNNNFDWITYVNNYEDLQKAGIDNENKALWHWRQFGIYEGRTYKKV